MTNNDILRRLRYSFEFHDHKMIALFAHVNEIVAVEQVRAWLKKEDDPEHVPCTDQQLAAFLNGLIIEKRGKKEGNTPVAEKKLTNNIIFNKLKIALSLTADDIIAMLNTVDFDLGKAELSALFRNSQHKHYRQCKDQILRNFIKAIQVKYRKSAAPKTVAVNKKLTDTQNEPEKREIAARPNASKIYHNPKSKPPEKLSRKVLKISPEEIWKNHK